MGHLLLCDTSQNVLPLCLDDTQDAEEYTEKCELCQEKLCAYRITTPVRDENEE
jgi:hypothetical protein